MPPRRAPTGGLSAASGTEVTAGYPAAAGSLKFPFPITSGAPRPHKRAGAPMPMPIGSIDRLVKSREKAWQQQQPFVTVTNVTMPNPHLMPRNLVFLRTTNRSWTFKHGKMLKGGGRQAADMEKQIVDAITVQQMIAWLAASRETDPVKRDLAFKRTGMSAHSATTGTPYGNDTFKFCKAWGLYGVMHTRAPTDKSQRADSEMASDIGNADTLMNRRTRGLKQQQLHAFVVQGWTKVLDLRQTEIRTGTQLYLIVHRGKFLNSDGEEVEGLTLTPWANKLYDHPYQWPGEPRKDGTKGTRGFFEIFGMDAIILYVGRVQFDSSARIRWKSRAHALAPYVDFNETIKLARDDVDSVAFNREGVTAKYRVFDIQFPKDVLYHDICPQGMDSDISSYELEWEGIQHRGRKRRRELDQADAPRRVRARVGGGGGGPGAL